MAQSIGHLLYLVFYVAILVLCVWALVDATRRPAGGFVAAGKRTKQFWTWILVAATFLALAAVVGSGIPFLGFLTLLAAVAAIVYLVDVKPALGPSGRGPRGGGPRRPPSSTGGW